jgi:hypothetical protein
MARRSLPASLIATALPLAASATAGRGVGRLRVAGV